MNKQELLSRLQGARSWREAGVSVEDVYNALLEDGTGESTHESGNVNKDISELREKVQRLTETNKQLRAENKQLRAGR